MPTYIDKHDLKGADEDALRELQDLPRDEFGVKHIDILFNKEEDKAWCIVNAPNKEAVDKHHKKIGYKCDSITKVHRMT